MLSEKKWKNIKRGDKVILHDGNEWGVVTSLQDGRRNHIIVDRNRRQLKKIEFDNRGIIQEFIKREGISANISLVYYRPSHLLLERRFY